MMDDRSNSRFWRLYQRNVASRVQFSLRDLGVAVGPVTTYGLVSTGPGEAVDRLRVERLVTLWLASAGATSVFEKEEEMSDERKIVSLCMEFLESAERVYEKRFHELLDAGVPVNFQHPRDLETAIHITCTSNLANALTERLLTHPDIDLLIRDAVGRQPWNNAVLFRIDQALADRVAEATMRQVDRQGIDRTDFEREHREYLARWMNEDWYWHLARRKGAQGPENS